MTVDDPTDELAAASGGHVQRIPRRDLREGEVLWHVDRHSPEPYAWERITKYPDGFWWVAVPARPDAQGLTRDGPDELRLDDEVVLVGPWPDERSAIGWREETLVLDHHDEVATCRLADDVVAEFVRADEHSEIKLGDRWWEILFGIPLPDWSDPVATWSVDPNYPGGDGRRTLHRVGPLYVACDDDWDAEILGRFDDDDTAIRAWAERQVPGGFAGYCEFLAEAEGDGEGDEWDEWEEDECDD